MGEFLEPSSGRLLRVQVSQVWGPRGPPCRRLSHDWGPKGPGSYDPPVGEIHLPAMSPFHASRPQSLIALKAVRKERDRGG